MGSRHEILLILLGNQCRASSGSSGRMCGWGEEGEQPSLAAIFMTYFYMAEGGGGAHGPLGLPGSATTCNQLTYAFWFLYEFALNAKKNCTIIHELNIYDMCKISQRILLIFLYSFLYLNLISCILNNL